METLYQCKQCREMFPFHKMKYDHAKRLICEECRVSVDKPPSRKADFVERPNEVTIKFKCKSCNYKFKRKDKPEYARVCPYCGKSTVERDKSISASQILSEI